MSAADTSATEDLAYDLVVIADDVDGDCEVDVAHDHDDDHDHDEHKDTTTKTITTTRTTTTMITTTTTTMTTPMAATTDDEDHDDNDDDNGGGDDGVGLPPRPAVYPSLVVLPEDKDRILARLGREPFDTLHARSPHTQRPLSADERLCPSRPLRLQLRLIERSPPGVHQPQARPLL